QAYANQAARTSGTDRTQAFSRAQRRHEMWIEMLTKEGGAVPSGAAGAATLAHAHLAYGNLLLGKQASPLLDQYDLQGGAGVERTALLDLLDRAESQYRSALKLAMPLYEQRADRGEEFQIAGIFDDLQRTTMDGQFNLAWTQLYIGMLQPATAKELARLKFRSAEAAFANLLNAGFTGESALQCRIGLGMSKCAQGSFEDAVLEFNRVLRESKDARISAQARNELARCQIENEKFDEARATLEPIRTLATQNAQDAPTFFKNLADLRYANSYFIEAEIARRAGSIVRAQAARIRAIAEMDKLSSRGGRWPQIVQLYLRQSVDPDANPRNLSPPELLVAARILLDRNDAAGAAERIRVALAMPQVTRDLHVPLRVELGRCEYALGNTDQAAEIFQDVALSGEIGEETAQAAKYAYQLLGRKAEQSREREDFVELADFLGKIQMRFPAHADMDDMRWLRAASLERSGQFAQAAKAYGEIASPSPRAEEARFRQVLCSKLFAQSGADELPAGEVRARLVEASRLLAEYAESAARRAAGASEAASILRFAAEARLHAAELLVDPLVNDTTGALQLLDSVTKAGENEHLLPRLLSLRIRALRRARKFDEANALVSSIVASLPPESATSLIAELADGMSEEVNQLRSTGDNEAAATLAKRALATLQQLEQSLSKQSGADAARLAQVRLMKAQMLYAAENFAEARTTLAPLLQSNADSGPVRRLDARLKTASLNDSPSWKDIEAAQAAWAAFLRDDQLRSVAPDVYWEARYHWLALAFRLGKAEDVEKAIRTERVWYPEMGGKLWKQRFDKLYAEVQQDLNTK
ncbi:MAG: tetratricopeptide repeat protein, partial [Phycisphaerae bacterium]